MEEKAFKGKEGLKNFLNQEKEKVTEMINERHYKALDYFNDGDLKNALSTIKYVIKHPMKEGEGVERDKKLFEDILLLKIGEGSKDTRQICYQGMIFLGVDNDIQRAVRLSLGLQNLIKKEKRDPSKEEQNFINITEDYLKRNSQS